MSIRTIERAAKRAKMGGPSHEPTQWIDHVKAIHLTKDGPVKEVIKIHPGFLEYGPNRQGRRAKLVKSWDYAKEVPPMWEALFKRTTNLIRATFTLQPEDPKPEPRVNYWGRVTGKIA